ncbi:MAG: helix-turn-helix domain-containing protein [Ruminococcus sp.]
MTFKEVLNDYITKLECTAKEISEVSGLSPATLSRYRSGERVPEVNSEAFEQICCAIEDLSKKHNIKGITKSSARESFLNCSDIITVNKEQLRKNFNTLISVMDINITDMCRHINYDSSTVFRIKNGSRNPSDPVNFASEVARFVSKAMNNKSKNLIMAELLECSPQDLNNSSAYFEKLRNWLIAGQGQAKDEIENLLKKLNDFNLNEYIKAIHFDELKVPSVPFQLPTSKAYFGLKNMMESELEFLKATVLSKSTAPVIMYSDMPMEEMAKDSEFPKKWMYGMAMMLKKGLHLNQIHNLDRSFEDMMLGLESWIPMYMTGQISPYYLKDVQNNVFLHLLKVSGTAALTGEAISGSHSDGKYYLTKNKDEVAYYRKRAEALLNKAHPLMNIYRNENAGDFNAFLLSDCETEGKRRNVLSVPPLFTLDKETIKQFLANKSLSEEEKTDILNYADSSRAIAEKVLKSNIVENEIPYLTIEEFKKYPVSLSLSGCFYEKNIPYTYEEYLLHLNKTEEFSLKHPNYSIIKTSSSTFRNLQIIMHEGKWAMISKLTSPAIHFVICHPKLRKAIENFIPPVVEN